MNPISLIIALLVAQAALVLGASVFFLRSKRQDRPVRGQSESMGELFGSEEANQPFDGYMINTDHGVTLDDIFRD